MAEMYPIFLKLENRDVLVVGGGKVAWRKLQALEGAGARLRVVTIEACEEVQAMSAAQKVTLELRAWQPADCKGAMLVVAATGDSEVNASIREEAHKAGALVNAVDDPPNCDFYVPAIVRKGDLRVAVSTQGKAPLIAGHLRERLERDIPDEWAEVINALAAERERVLAAEPDEQARLQKLRAFLDAELSKRGMDK